MKSKDRILLEILNRTQSSQIKVTELRDQLMAHYGNESLDPAATRRWVNGKCTTLVNRGLLTRKQLPNSKKYGFEKTPAFESYFNEKVSIASGHEPVAMESVDKAELNTNALHDELESYRQTMLSQLGEIEEYRRIREEYPELGNAAAEQFRLAVDDNYRMLGRIRAIEKLIASTGSQL